MVTCCCCSLQTGSLIIAIFFMIISTVIVTLSSLALGVLQGTEGVDNLMIAVTCIGVLSIFFAILLLFGIVKKVPMLMKIWIVFQCVVLILDIIAFFKNIGSANHSILLRQLSKTNLMIYFLYVVHGHCKELEAEKNQFAPKRLAETSVSDEGGSVELIAKIERPRANKDGIEYSGSINTPCV